MYVCMYVNIPFGGFLYHLSSLHMCLPLSFFLSASVFLLHGITRWSGWKIVGFGTLESSCCDAYTMVI